MPGMPMRVAGFLSIADVTPFGLNQDQAIRAGLTLFIVLVALSGGSWLARRAGKVPIPLETRLERYRTARNVNAKALDKGRPTTERSMGVSRWLGRVTFVSVWIAALLAIALIWLWHPQKTWNDILQQLGTFGGQVGGSLVVLACTLGLGRLLQRGFISSLPKNVNRNLATLGGRIVYITTLAIGAIIILTIWGTGLVVPVALLGALTVALSLALQDVLKNLVAGIYLLLEHPFVIGDRITLTPYSGEIEDIQIRYTALIMEGGERVLIPNSMLFSSPVINLSEAQRRRAALTVTVPGASSSSIDRAEQGIRAALESVSAVYRDPEPQVTVSRATGNKVDFQVVFWTPVGDFGQSAAIYSDVIEKIRLAVEDAEISLLDPTASAVV